MLSFGCGTIATTQHLPAYQAAASAGLCALVGVCNLDSKRARLASRDPGGLAVWTILDLAALGEIADELNDAHRPIELETVGTYADFGQEIL